MAVNGTKLALMGFLLACSGNAFAQSGGKEPAAIVELGGAGEWSLAGEGASFGPNLAVEVTPIEKWLELEGGVTRLFGRHAREWDADFLFKKPWDLSRKAELMVGVGPEWVHTNSNGVMSNSVAGEAALDFMFWPSGKHRFGWYLEPAYDYSFGRGHERSVGITGGLLIAIP